MNPHFVNYSHELLRKYSLSCYPYWDVWPFARVQPTPDRGNLVFRVCACINARALVTPNESGVLVLHNALSEKCGQRVRLTNQTCKEKTLTLNADDLLADSEKARGKGRGTHNAEVGWQTNLMSPPTVPCRDRGVSRL